MKTDHLTREQLISLVHMYEEQIATVRAANKVLRDALTVIATREAPVSTFDAAVAAADRRQS
jgi:hypothetical protein